MDSGVPQTSKRAGSRVAGAATTAAGTKGKTAEAKGVTPKSTGSGGARPGPVDPRTEDPSSPLGLARAGKALWRRPGALTPRTAKHRETGRPEMPIEFSVATPLAPAEPESPVITADDKAPEIVIEPTVWAPMPTSALPVVAPTAPVPTELVPTGLLPTELVPSEAPALPDVTLRAPILYDQAATITDVTQIGPVLESRPLRRPIQFRRAPKPRVRRVTRVVRHVDTWSVFKVAMVFSVFFYAVSLVAGVLLWQVAYATGTIDNVEKFFEGFGWETFKFNGGQIYHNAWIAGLFVAVGLTGLAVLMATLFNLITDLVGGIRFSVLEEEVRSRVERGTEPVPAAPSVVFDTQSPSDTVDGSAELADDTMAVESDGASPVA